MNSSMIRLFSSKYIKCSTSSLLRRNGAKIHIRASSIPTQFHGSTVSVSSYQNNLLKSYRQLSSIPPKKENDTSKDNQSSSPLLSGTHKQNDVSSSFISKLDPYYRLARLDKPIGTMLLLWPCYWSICLAAPIQTLPDIKLLTLFSIGALVMRGAGCTINDYWDRDIDGLVERTKTRPIPSGEVTPKKAIHFFILQSLIGLGILVQLPTNSIILGACSMPLVIAYPLAKRYFIMPQLVLGSAFNWGALLGGAAVATNGLPVWEWAVPLYVGSIGWTLVYDTLYAHQDKVNDKELGLYSSALTLGNENTKPFLLGCSIATVSGIALAGYTADMNWPFYAATSLGAAQLVWQVQDAKLDDPEDLWRKFTSNNSFGAIITLGIIAGHF